MLRAAADVTPEQLSKCMAAIKGRNTNPELTIRSVQDTFKIGYDLHTADLPGKPDMVLPRRKKVIFVHGCFWHMHRCRYGRVKPAANCFTPPPTQFLVPLSRNHLTSRILI